MFANLMPLVNQMYAILHMVSERRDVLRTGTLQLYGVRDTSHQAGARVVAVEVPDVDFGSFSKESPLFTGNLTVCPNSIYIGNYWASETAEKQYNCTRLWDSVAKNPLPEHLPLSAIHSIPYPNLPLLKTLEAEHFQKTNTRYSKLYS